MRKIILMAAAFVVSVALPCAAQQVSNGSAPKLQPGDSFRPFAAADAKKADAEAGHGVDGKDLGAADNKDAADEAGQGSTDAACPHIAKLCPDGSSVSAAGPNCEYPKCPGDKTPGNSGGDCAQTRLCPGGSTVPLIGSGVKKGSACVYQKCPDKRPVLDTGPVCPAMARLCPGGSSVGMVRVGQKCEFAKCPGDGAAGAGDSSGTKVQCGSCPKCAKCANRK